MAFRASKLSHLQLPGTLRLATRCFCLESLPKFKVASGRVLSKGLYPSSGSLLSSSSFRRHKSSKSDDFEELDKPIKFTTSKASNWDVRQTFQGTVDDDTPDIQPLSMFLSIGVFLIYFCILREENDIDEEMGKSLWERVPGLERKQLDVVYDYNSREGIDNTAVLARMRELDALAEQARNKDAKP